MQKIKDFHGVIVAAGTGERFGGDRPKQYWPLHGRPVLRHSLETFLQMPGLASLTVVINPAHRPLYDEAAAGLSLRDPVAGGKDRKESTFKALKSLSHLKNDAMILIHDAARPFVDKSCINSLLAALEDHEAATLASPVSDTLRHENGAPVDRSGLWAVQTPQAFRYGTLKKAHETLEGNYTDDAGLVSAMGLPVKLVTGPKNNIKITVLDDLTMAELFINGETRTGMGFDVHAFSADPKRKLMLCGLEIPGARGLEGHSDADVALHALTDAILGAIGAGDIGQHFPPSNTAFKNMDSRVFLEEACKMLTARNGALQNADITLICEEPKIGPHRAAMQAKVAEILQTNTNRVNIKATTTEGLGFTGRREGIAAQAVVTVKITI